MAPEGNGDGIIHAQSLRIGYEIQAFTTQDMDIAIQMGIRGLSQLGCSPVGAKAQRAL